MIHIGDIIPKPSDKWADMPKIPRELDELDKRERRIMGCLCVIVGLVLIFASLSIVSIFLI